MRIFIILLNGQLNVNSNGVKIFYLEKKKRVAFTGNIIWVVVSTFSSVSSTSSFVPTVSLEVFYKLFSRSTVSHFLFGLGHFEQMWRLAIQWNDFNGYIILSYWSILYEYIDSILYIRFRARNVLIVSQDDFRFVRPRNHYFPSIAGKSPIRNNLIITHTTLLRDTQLFLLIGIFFFFFLVKIVGNYSGHRDTDNFTNYSFQ